MLVSSFWFVVALLSGAERYGGGLYGIFRNSPNALPWLVLFVLVYVSWRWERVGGILVAALGVVTVFFFNAADSPPVLWAVSVPLFVCGVFLGLGGHLKKRRKSGA